MIRIPIGGPRCRIRFAQSCAALPRSRWPRRLLPSRSNRSRCTAPCSSTTSHPFNKALLKFQELTAKYYGKPINFVLHRNSELGLEKDYFAYMSQGISVDYAIVSPAHMSTFAKAAPLLDMPFLFRDLDHWNKVLDSDAFQPIVDDVSEEGRRDDHRLRRRRHAQHHRQQAGAQHGRAAGACRCA